MNHEKLMRRCIELAKSAKAEGNVPVGSIIVHEGEIIAEAKEIVPMQNSVTGHAEVIVGQITCDVLGTMDLSECTLYTTAEPCWMCSYAIRDTKIGMVVIGSPTPHVGALSTDYRILDVDTVPYWRTSPEVIVDILREECDALREGG